MNTLRVALLSVCFLYPPASAQEYSVRDNVFAVLETMNLQNSVEVLETHQSYILARPRNKDGVDDNSLWFHIQASRLEGTSDWIHDNVVLSRLIGHGRHSYRQRGRPSMQAVFYFQKNSTLPHLIKLDVDRFPPGSNCVTSTRHFLQEMIPNMIFGKTTDQQRMAGAIARRYKNAKVTTDRQQTSDPIE